MRHFYICLCPSLACLSLQITPYSTCSLYHRKVHHQMLHYQAPMPCWPPVRVRPKEVSGRRFEGQCFEQQLCLLKAQIPLDRTSVVPASSRRARSLILPLTLQVKGGHSFTLLLIPWWPPFDFSAIL